MLEGITGMNRMHFDFIPDYLCTINPSLEKSTLSILPSSINLEELGNVVILMHTIMSIELVHHLWLLYRQASRGKLQSNLTINHTRKNIRCWSKAHRSIIRPSTNQYLYEDLF